MRRLRRLTAGFLAGLFALPGSASAQVRVPRFAAPVSAPALGGVGSILAVPAPSLTAVPLFAAPSLVDAPVTAQVPQAAAPAAAVADQAPAPAPASIHSDTHAGVDPAQATSAASAARNPEELAAQSAAAFDQALPAAAPAKLFIPSESHSRLIAAIVGDEGISRALGWLTTLGASAPATDAFHMALFAVAAKDEDSAERVLAAQRVAQLISLPLTREPDRDVGEHDKAAILAAALLRALPENEGRAVAVALAEGMGYKGSPAWLAYGDTHRVAEAGPANHHWYRRWRRRLSYAEEAMALISSPGAPDFSSLRRELALVGDPMFAWLPAQFQEYFLSRSRPALARKAGVETTSEFELSGPGVLHRIAATPGGTLAPFVSQEPKNSKWKGRGREAWETLAPDDKKELVENAVRRRRLAFWSERSLPIVKVRNTAQVDFRAQTLFEGKIKDPGTTDVRLKSYFRDGIERGGPLSGAEVLEVHYRSAQSAGRAMLDSRRLVGALGFPSQGQHQHVPVPLPERIKADPEFESLRLADYYRRLNLFLEMDDVVAGGGIGAKVRKGIVFFGYLTRANLAGVRRYLRDAGLGRRVKTGDDFKIAWIGFWGQDKYDKPGMIGFESRALSAHKSVPLIYGFQERLQIGLLSGDYGIKPEAFKLWLDRRAAEGMSGEKALTSALYQRSWAEAFRQPEAAGVRPDTQKWLKAQRQDQQFKMLFFDWSREPALADRPEVLEAVRRSQEKLKTDIAEGRWPDMREFLLGSGLYDALADSLDLVER